MSATELNRIESDLAAARTRLDGRLGLLQDRFTPGRLADDAMAYLRSSGGSEFVDTLTGSVKRNPLPVALTGIGIAWLIAASQRATEAGAPHNEAAARRSSLRTSLAAAERDIVREPSDTDEMHRDRLNVSRAHAMGIAQEAGEDKASFANRITAMVESVRGSAVAGVHDMRDGAANLSNQVSGVASQVAGTVSGTTERAGNAGRHVGDRMAKGVEAGRQTASGMAANLLASPAMLGALGLAAGAVLAAMIPQTDQEETALGGFAGHVRQAAGDAAQAVLDKGGSVAGATIDKGRKSLQQHGLSGDKTAGDYVDGALSGETSKNLKEVIVDAMDAGEAAVRK